VFKKMACPLPEFPEFKGPFWKWAFDFLKCLAFKKKNSPDT
jgi:hypothetical protein